MNRSFTYFSVVFAGLVLAASAAGTARAAKPPAPSRADREAAAKVAKDLEFATEMVRKGLWREALFRWERVLVQRPDDPHLLNNIAVAREALGDREGARQAYERALVLSTERPIDDNFIYFRRVDPAPEPAAPGDAAAPSPAPVDPGVTPPAAPDPAPTPDPARDGSGRRP
jgi:tetratricopeptide (TPR) repeat protein